MQTPRIERKILESSCAGARVQVPVTTMTGGSDGPTLAVIAGVHGSEYAGIVAAMQLSRTLLKVDLEGVVRIVPICNIPAFYGRSECVCPVDGKNLNRVFPGNPAGTYSDVLADLVFGEIVEGSDCVLNVHGGDIFEKLLPYAGIAQIGDEALVRQCADLGHVYDLPYVVTFAGKSSESYGMDLNTAAQARGIPAMLVEAGGEGVLRQEEADIHLKGMTNIMKHLGMIEGDVVREQRSREMTTDFWRIPNEGVFLPSVKLGDCVKAGQQVGTLFDWHGELMEEVPAPADAEILAIVTTPAARKGAVMYQVVY